MSTTVEPLEAYARLAFVEKKITEWVSVVFRHERQQRFLQLPVGQRYRLIAKGYGV